MDNTQEVITSPSSQLPPTPPASPHTSFPKLVVISLLMLILGLGIGYLIPTKILVSPAKSDTSTALNPPPTITSTNPNIVAPTEASTPNAIKWVRVKTLVSFVYPYGWHVAELWPNSGGEGIRTEINKEPISTAPRDGGFSDIAFTYLNGFPNAEEEMQKRIATAKKDMKVLEEKELQGEQVKIKYIKFRFTSEAYGDKDMDSYYLLIPSTNTNDKINDAIITASIDSDSANAPILQKIMLSIRK